MLKRTCIAVLLLAAPLSAAEPKLSADLPYAEPKNELHLLDVYAPAEGRNHPIIVWLHGGGRTKGQKAGVDHKAQAFIADASAVSDSALRITSRGGTSRGR